ncbi:hypothetical protein UNDYM_0593 [Undibacterium sp. YM2]|nr:hypothetical protein UNDYM_0593 [Undibacterium sp. YM2]
MRYTEQESSELSEQSSELSGFRQQSSELNENRQLLCDCQCPAVESLIQ